MIPAKSGPREKITVPQISMLMGFSPLETAEQWVSGMRHQTGFTLIELLIVLIIIGILVGLSLPNFAKTKQAVFDQEAKVALRLIQSAQKLYFLKTNQYYPPAPGSADVFGINDNLGLELNSENWDYGINTLAGSNDFTATAQRGMHLWRISATNDVY